jgi:hypothetical protein
LTARRRTAPKRKKHNEVLQKYKTGEPSRGKPAARARLMETLEFVTDLIVFETCKAAELRNPCFPKIFVGSYNLNVNQISF